MKRKLRVAATAGALALALALVLAACGGDDGGGASAADRESEARDAALKFAQCMREQGIDMPDPTFEGGGTLQSTPDEDVPEAKLEEAEKACRKHLEGIEPPELSEEEQQEFKKAALAFARCMREHGIENYPDPTIGEGGRVEQSFDKGSGIDPNDPDFKEAEEACQDEMPQAPGQESGP